MKKAIEQGILKYLAGVALAFAAGTVDPAPELRKVPESLLGDIVEEVEEAEWQPEARNRMLDLLTHDPRPMVRVRVSEAVVSVWNEVPDQAVVMLRRLVDDESGLVRAAAAAGLADVLARASVIERVALVAEWTISEKPTERLALARALCASTPVLIGDLAIDQLTRDPEPTIRRWALMAANSHLEDNPALYATLAHELLEDPDAEVRATARRILESVSPA
jgi:hypothetical protein